MGLTHMCTHMHTHAYAHAHAHTHKYPCIHTHMNVYPQSTRAHVCRLTHTGAPWPVQPVCSARGALGADLVTIMYTVYFTGSASWNSVLLVLGELFSLKGDRELSFSPFLSLHL